MKEKERDELDMQVRNQAYKIHNTKKSDADSVREQFPELGLCNKCGCLRGIVTEFGLRGAFCAGAMTKLDGKQRIKHCTSFWNIHHIPIDILIPMTIMVDPKKETIGF